MKRATYTVAEATQLLGISMSSIYSAIRRGEIPVIRVGRRVLIPRSLFNDLLGYQPITEDDA